jgi:anti-sigma-K factor RskA
MKRHSDSEALIVNYLLGALPEAELERFERRFLEDETLFEELQEIEDELIDDYVSGTLSGEQRTLFEKYFLRSAKRREKLEFARALTEHARIWKNESATAAHDQSQSAESSAADGKVLPFKRWSQPVPAWRQWAAVAAVVLIAVALGVLWLRNRELRRELIAADADSARLRQQAEGLSARAADTAAQLSAEQQQTQELEEQLEKLQKTISANGPRKVVTSAMLGVEYFFRGGRGDDQKKVRTFAIPDNAGVVRLGLEFEKSRFEIFKITLRRKDGGTVWTRGGLKPRVVADKQSITLAIPAETLPAGNYEVLVSGVPSDGPVESLGRFFIKVERQR